MGSCLSLPNDEPPVATRQPPKYVVSSTPSYPPTYTYATMPQQQQQQPQPSAPVYEPLQYKNPNVTHPYATPVYQYYQTTGGNPQIITPTHYLPPNYYQQQNYQQPYQQPYQQQSSGMGNFVTGMIAGAVVADILDDISDP
jgi:hypothetical protein